MTWRAIAIALGVIGCLGVLYLSWVPDPNIGSQPYFPESLGRWVNVNWNLRTAVPFVFLAAIAEIVFAEGRRISKRSGVIATCLVMLVILAETGQLFLANRHFDFGDIAWGFAGTLAGLVIGLLVKSIFKK